MLSHKACQTWVGSLSRISTGQGSAQSLASGSNSELIASSESILQHIERRTCIWESPKEIGAGGRSARDTAPATDLESKTRSVIHFQS